MAAAFRLGPIDDAYGALQAILGEHFRMVYTSLEQEQILRQPGFVQDGFIALRQSTADPFALRRPVPIRRGGDGPVISRKADRDALATVLLPHELADV